MERELLLGVLVPALLAAALAAASWQPWRRTPEGQGPRSIWAGGIAMALGYLFGHVAIAGWPPLQPTSAQHWLPYLAAVGALLSLTTTSSRRALRWTPQVLIAALVPWVLFGKKTSGWGAAEGTLWLGLAYAVLLLWWLALAGLIRRLPGRPLTVVLGVLVAGMGATFALSNDVQTGLLAGSVGGALAGLAILVWLVPDRCPLDATVPALALLLVPMLEIQHTDFFGYVPQGASACLVMAPLSAWFAIGLGAAGPVSGRRAWLTLLPVALLCGAAAWLAHDTNDFGY